MLEFGNKEFRNLQQQVGKNKEDIESLKRYGDIKIDYTVMEVEDLAPLLTQENVGKYVYVSVPKKLYLLTKRANGGLIAVVMGDYPAVVEGPAGQDGAVGATGERGTGIFGVGAELPSPTGYKYGDMYLLNTGALYKNVAGAWVLQCSIRGPQGLMGESGDSDVEANPSEDYSDNLTKIKIDGIVYSIEELDASQKAMIANLLTYGSWDESGGFTFGNDLEVDGDLEVHGAIKDDLGHSTDVSKIVTTDDNQTITGYKTFKGAGLSFKTADNSSAGSIAFEESDRSIIEYITAADILKIGTESGGGEIEFRQNGISKAHLEGINLYPDLDSGLNLGKSDKRFINLYVSNLISDGTNSVSISTIESTNNRSTSISAASTNTQYPSAKAVYDYVDTVKRNHYQKVDTTTYPTLADFLATTGEEGYIYLYPVNVLDESEGYYQYIYESAWLSLGTTSTDVSNVVTLNTNQTITGSKTFSSAIIAGNDGIQIGSAGTLDYDTSFPEVQLVSTDNMLISATGGDIALEDSHATISDLGKIVTSDTAQTITGAKTMTKILGGTGAANALYICNNTFDNNSNTFGKNLLPVAGQNINLGSTGDYAFNKLYLKDKIYNQDGTNSVSVDDIVAGLGGDYVVLKEHTPFGALTGDEVYKMRNGGFVPTFAGFFGQQRQSIFLQLTYISGSSYKAQGWFLDSNRNLYFYEGKINNVSEGSSSSVSYSNFKEIKFSEIVTKGLEDLTLTESGGVYMSSETIPASTHIHLMLEIETSGLHYGGDVDLHPYDSAICLTAIPMFIDGSLVAATAYIDEDGKVNVELPSGVTATDIVAHYFSY